MNNQAHNNITTFAQKAINYYFSLKAPLFKDPSPGIINPYEKLDVQEIVRAFYYRYYNDQRKRVFLLGINPGRFGGGLTGISFTDPVALRKYCGIENELGTQRELSSEFVYLFINKFGGPEAFFSRFYLSALYPLAITKNGKNYNYYDEASLYKTLKPHIIESLTKQVNFGAEKRFAICLGKKNEKYLSELNSELKLFDKIYTLEHPRYIMQYKRRVLGDYLNNYQSLLSELSLA
ncbi:MAG: uracil-DNA glycosylase family protein [Bacillota bacterium]